VLVLLLIHGVPFTVVVVVVVVVDVFVVVVVVVVNITYSHFLLFLQRFQLGVFIFS
jgi:hypothetical protein